jgi:hypothetical protein
MSTWYARLQGWSLPRLQRRDEPELDNPDEVGYTAIDPVHYGEMTGRQYQDASMLVRLLSSAATLMSLARMSRGM